MLNCLVTDIGLGDPLHLDSRHDPRRNAALLKAVCQSQSVDHSGEHAHVVRPNALHPVAAVLQTAPEVAAAHYNADLQAVLNAPLNNVAHLTDDLEVQAAMCVAGKRFSADLQQDASVFQFLFRQVQHSLFSLLLFYLISLRLTRIISRFDERFFPQNSENPGKYSVHSSDDMLKYTDKIRKGD